MRATIFLLISLCMCLIFACKDNDEDRVTDQWKELLSDPDLTAWKKQGDFSTTVENGVLTLSGAQPGWLLYEGEVEDFIFETEFLVKEGQVSGIAFRYPEALGGDPAFIGYKVTIDHNLDQQNPTGSIFNVARAKWLKGTDTDDWNKLAIEARGDHLKVLVNDTLVAETHDRRSDEGMIGLQAYGDANVAQFRNMRLKELEDVEYLGPQIEDYMRSYTLRPMEPLISGVDLSDWRPVGDANWSIEDGVIHGYSNEAGGFLVHKNTYRNFYLKLKFKIKHEDNSGIFIRHDPEMPDAVGIDNAIECNIYDHDGYLHEYSTGSIAPIARAWSKLISYEDWNEMEIFAFEDQICMYVNGIKSSEAHLPEQFNQKGNICIQGGIQVFNNNLPSDIHVKDMYVRDFEGITKPGG